MVEIVEKPTIAIDLTKVTSKDIQKALKQRYQPTGVQFGISQWVYFSNLRTGTGYSKGCEQELDGWCMQLWGEKHRITFEIKISRSDFLAEIKKPLKRRLGLLLSNEFYFVTPKGLLKQGEIPIETGLLELCEDGRVQKIIDAPFRDSSPPTWNFTASLCRRIVREEIEGEGK